MRRVLSFFKDHITKIKYPCLFVLRGVFVTNASEKRGRVHKELKNHPILTICYRICPYFFDFIISHALSKRFSPTESGIISTQEA